MLGFKLDYKLEQAGENAVIVHRRVLTPFFYIRLHPLAAEFKEQQHSVMFYPHPLAGCVAVALPYNRGLFTGQWEVNGKSFNLKALDLIKASYYTVKKIK